MLTEQVCRPLSGTVIKWPSVEPYKQQIDTKKKEKKQDEGSRLSGVMYGIGTCYWFLKTRGWVGNGEVGEVEIAFRWERESCLVERKQEEDFKDGRTGDVKMGVQYNEGRRWDGGRWPALLTLWSILLSLSQLWTCQYPYMLDILFIQI